MGNQNIIGTSVKDGNNSILKVETVGDKMDTNTQDEEIESDKNLKNSFDSNKDICSNEQEKVEGIQFDKNNQGNNENGISFINEDNSITKVKNIINNSQIDTTTQPDKEP